ncbi:MAG: Mut7-C RNAse domain-containing protein [Thermoplasmata archaeon]|nr:Mut7-C RNAse domain-containing protein [Thermoplasmata archaeon]
MPNVPVAALLTDPQWLADEMVGRLARYLRMLGQDTEYVRGARADEIVRRSRDEGRVLLTRNHALAARVTASVLLEGSEIGVQLQELHRAYPLLGFEVQMTRCTLCNGRLLPWSPSADSAWPEGLPRARVEAGLSVFGCSVCHHLYWEGSHTARLRHDLANWFRSDPR